MKDTPCGRDPRTKTGWSPTERSGPDSCLEKFRNPGLDQDQGLGGPWTPALWDKDLKN